MRKISYTMAKKFYHAEPFSSGNTTVTVSGNVVQMLLHGNLIAMRDITDPVPVLHITLAGWGTITTRERLNGLLSYYTERNNWLVPVMFWQEKGQQYFQDAGSFMDVINSKDWISIYISNGDLKGISNIKPENKE